MDLPRVWPLISRHRYLITPFVTKDREKAIDASTRYCAVLGHPIHHSASPAFQNAGMDALALNWRYLAFDVHPEELANAIDGAKAMKFIGLNLTVPHKVLALDMMDTVDASARSWGAVNTVRFESQSEDGRWHPISEMEPSAISNVRGHGFNTDADAITESLRRDLDVDIRNARILLLGSGGAGRVAALKLAADGVHRLHLINRTMSKAEEVAKEIGGLFPSANVGLGYPNEPVEVIINATSLGMNPDDSLPLDTHRFPITDTRKVFDMIYRPAETPLLKEAKGAGCATANGVGMLLHQGVSALRIWSGLTPPVETMRQALESHLYESPVK